jgi:hypothetical protein
MNTRKEKDPMEMSSDPSKRARLDTLLFNGASPGPALVEPKLPRLAGD